MFRFAAYVLLICVALFLFVLGAIVVNRGPGEVGSEASLAIAILAIVILILILIVRFLLCLARAKDRLREERRLYREAHGTALELRKEADALLERLRSDKFELGRCSRICDILVRKKLPKDCIRLPFEVTRYPDPCIYNQFFLMANNQPVTWDNPNVEIFLGGNVQDTYNLAVDTTYQVRVGIENASPFFDALGTQVQVNMLTFGIGQPTPTPIHSFSVDVPAATAFPGVQETFDWTTPTTAGHYCIQVLIQHATDINPANNEGWNNTNVRDVATGTQFVMAIPIANPLQFDVGRKHAERIGKEFSAIVIELDSYELNTANLEEMTPTELFEPAEPVWGAEVTPGALQILPGARGQDLEFKVTVPADAAGKSAVFNISARADDRSIGGVTIRLNVQ